MFDREYFNIGYLDTLSYGDSPVHRLDPRVKLLVAGLFAATVVSYGKYEIRGLMPFFVYPVFLLAAGDIPIKYIGKKLLYLSPFPLLIGLFNPLIDTEPRAVFFGMEIAGGWLSLLSIMVKFVLTTGVLLLLIATTPFPLVCVGLRRLRVPALFVSLLLFLYRYIFVLLEEVLRMLRARDMRSFGKRGLPLRGFTGLAGVLFIRTYERAGRIYRAMLSRGYSGEVHSVTGLSMGKGDMPFLLTVSALLIFLRVADITGFLGGIVVRGIRQ